MGLGGVTVSQWDQRCDSESVGLGGVTITQ